MPASLEFISNVPNRPVGDLTRLNLIYKELQKIYERQLRAHIMDSDQYLESALSEVLTTLDEYLNYEPSDAEMGYDGEPPLSADERWKAAHEQHRQLHS